MIYGTRFLADFPISKLDRKRQDNNLSNIFPILKKRSNRKCIEVQDYFRQKIVPNGMKILVRGLRITFKRTWRKLPSNPLRAGWLHMTVISTDRDQWKSKYKLRFAQNLTVLLTGVRATNAFIEIYTWSWPSMKICWRYSGW